MDEQMKRWLEKDIAKSCFVNCFKVAHGKDGAITEDDVRRCHGERGAVSIQKRAREIRRVFETGRECELLRECCTNRDYPESAAKAKDLLDEYCK